MLSVVFRYFGWDRQGPLLKIDIRPSVPDRLGAPKFGQDQWHEVISHLVVFQ